MKITQIMLAEGFGGAERHFVDLSLSLADRNYQIQAICHSKFAHQGTLSQHPNIQVTPIRIWGKWDLFAANHIQNAIAHFSPHIIHTHLARGAYMGGKAAKALNIPSVVNLHNYVNLKYYGNINHFIAATEDQKNYLKKQAIAAEHITVMPHFSLLPAVPPKPLPENQPIKFMALGRMVKKKGFDVLIRAFRAYLDAGHGGLLAIGGDGVEQEHLVQLVSELKLTDKVEFNGWIEEIATFLANGDVFILPSLDEPFGIVVLEAMASGKPIITTKTQGPITILSEESAYFTEIGEVDSLTQAMIALSQHKAVATQKAISASRLYQTTYAADAVVPKVETIYRHLSKST
ncbi:MAG: glycosyltransferase family 4 protein [Methylophilus sp.]|nr:glycosyltransferase family 4 protein [Methylophilus sp.]